jgi:pseudolysin
MKFKLTLLVTSLMMANIVSAATAVDLSHQSINYLHGSVHKTSFAAGPVQLKEIRTDIDQNQTTHKRIQQTYAGYPVWGATAVVHTAKPAVSNGTTRSLAAVENTTTMNGVVYEGLEKDLASTASFALSDAQKAKALADAKLAYELKTGLKGLKYTQEESKTIVYVDNDKQAHYAYLVSFYVDDHISGAHRPTMIMDATSLRIFKTWDQVMTEGMQTAGGIGGNEKTGAMVYDDSTGNLPAFNMQTFDREIEILPGQKVKMTFCLLQNESIEVQDVSYDSQVVMSSCLSQPGLHNNLPWLSNDANGTRWNDDAMNGGFSPSLDAFYAGTIVQKLYHDWYGIPALIEDDGKTPMKLIMRVHYGRKFDNAYWDGKQMTFGDGGSMFYPLTSLDVGAHEISHGFTQQHSNIDGSFDQMGALHESFSDMAASAAEFYTSGKNTWKMGINITKGQGALRYMDNPKKDGSSLDNMNDFKAGMDPHLLAGVFNKAFYLIATTRGWDTHKAFDVMVKANMHYWNSSMQTFEEAACGVVSATRDYKYKVSDVRVAFTKVGVETDKCN